MTGHHALFLGLSIILLCNCGGTDTVETLPLAEEPARLPVLTEVAEYAGLGNFRHQNGAFGKMWFPEQMGAGCGFIDYDGDGWLDIILVGGGELAPNTIDPLPEALSLFRNRRDGTFEPATEAAGLAGIRAYGTGITAADYDNDGDEDIFFTTLRQNMLFRNEGGRFVDVSASSGIVEPVRWSSSAVFFDADNDGWLDLYVGNYSDWTPEKDIWCSLDGKSKVYCGPAVYQGVASTMFHNNGDGTFSDISESAGFMPAPGKALGIAELDYNRDGWPDLVVANDGEGDLLYENNGNGTFTEKGMMSGIAYGENGEARAGMGIDAGVTDETGETTVFIGNFSSEMIGVYRYSSTGWFIDRAAVSRIGKPSLLRLTFGVFLCDFDFDGDLDLLAANGHVYPVRTKYQDGVEYRQLTQLFLNRGDGIFREASDQIGGALMQKMVARGAAYGDYDRDGDPDVLISENGGPAHLWRNDFRNPNFLRVRLQATKGNRDGIGAQIIATAGSRKMYRRIHTGSGYLSNSERVATFGLAESTVVDTLAIHWPGGHRDEFININGNQEIRIIETENKYESIKLFHSALIAGDE